MKPFSQSIPTAKRFKQIPGRAAGLRTLEDILILVMDAFAFEFDVPLWIDPPAIGREAKMKKR